MPASETCGKFAGSGQPQGGGNDHFVQDARLFASWGVDYLKLDGCNVYVPAGSDRVAAYRKAYAAESAALKSTAGRLSFRNRLQHILNFIRSGTTC